jgi:hypothetical protein
MTDLEFMDCAELLLGAVERNCDRINDETDADVDNQRVGGMVTLVFANRSQAIEESLYEKIERIEHRRLTEECAKLDPVEEQQLAEEGTTGEIETWPEY